MGGCWEEEDRMETHRLSGRSPAGLCPLTGPAQNDEGTKSRLLGFRYRWDFHFREQFFVELGIHHDLVDDHLFRWHGCIP